jgi:hypothetical protein
MGMTVGDGGRLGKNPGKKDAFLYCHALAQSAIVHFPRKTTFPHVFRMKSPLFVVLAAACLSLTPRLPAAVVFGDPQIQASPAMPVIDGSTVTLTAQAQPDSGFALYLWFKNGVSLSNGGRISGATTNKLVIKGIQKADEGAYRVQLREVLIGGGVDDPVLSDPIDVAVNVRPIITAQPVAPAAAINQDGFLSLNVGISAQSEQPLTYEWQLNNVPIDSLANPSAATDTFTLLARDPMNPVDQPGVQWADAGSYRVRVTNATGINVFSKPVKVTVNSAAVLLSDLPAEFFIATKAKGKLSVLAGGTPKLAYQWSINGEDILKGGNASSISIAGTPENDGKVFRVTVTNAATDVEHPAAVSSGTTIRVINKLISPLVSGSLGMDTYQKGFTFDKGTTPVLEALASTDNTGTLEYQWQKDGRNISDSATVTGTNARQLVFSDLAWADRGVYRCIVRNPVSVVTSKTFVLGVNSPPVILTEPAAANVAITGGKAVFGIIASGSGKLTYQWFKKDAGGDIPLLKATKNKLTLGKLLRNLDKIGGDDYYCEVENSFTATLGGGTATRSADANLVVYDPVKITTHPQAPNDGVRVGNNLTLNVVISGDDPVVYEWYLNKKTRLVNGPLGSATVIGADTANLQINGMQPALQGSYSCIVRNALIPGPGPARYLVNLTSKAAKVVVVVPPSIAQQTSVSPASPVMEDETVTLAVLGSGTGPLKYQWQRRFDPAGTWVDMPGKTAAKLVFSRIQLEDDAYYRCKVDNILNEPVFSNSLDLDVNPIPGATITDFFPVVGRTGDLVRVRGANMQYVRSATIGTASAPVTAESNTSVLLTVPAGVTLNAPVLVKLMTKRIETASVGSFIRRAVASNDDPTEATILVGRSVTYSGSNVDFATSANFVDPSAAATAWFWWRAPSAGNYRIGVNANFDTGLARHTGDITAPTFAAPYGNINGFSGETLTFTAVEGADYYFAVAGQQSTTGDFILTLTSLTPSPLAPPGGAALAAAEETPAPAPSPAYDYRLGGSEPEGSEPHTLTGLRPDPAAEGDQVTAHFTLSLELPEDGVSNDGFAWTLFGEDEVPLAGLWIAAADGRVSISTAAGGYQPTEMSLAPATPYEVEIWVDRAAGTWSARINGVPLGESAPLPAGSAFFEVAPVWQPSTDGSPHAAMSFRDLRVEVH